jgi:hypothetical protein
MKDAVSLITIFILLLGSMDVLALLLPEEDWQSRSKSGLTLVVGAADGEVLLSSPP